MITFVYVKHLNNLSIMVIDERFVVYEPTPLIGISSEHELLALKKVAFKGWVSNDFETEKDAIDALIKDNMTYCDYLIIKTVFIRKS